MDQFFNTTLFINTLSSSQLHIQGRYQDMSYIPTRIVSQEDDRNFAYWGRSELWKRMPSIICAHGLHVLDQEKVGKDKRHVPALCS